MPTAKLLATALVAMGLAAPAMAQQMPAQPGQGDQVDQLDQLLDLDDAQKQEIRGLLEDVENRLGPKEQQAQTLQMQLNEHVGPDYDEAAIRQDAARLGELTGEMMAESTLMQARVEAVFTEEQRQQLEEQIAQQQQQMQQMQEQMQQQGQQDGQPLQ
jgi:periplasmic protein CpxP/Spy